MLPYVCAASTSVSCWGAGRGLDIAPAISHHLGFAIQSPRLVGIESGASWHGPQLERGNGTFAHFSGVFGVLSAVQGESGTVLFECSA
jgi:hypothetical protein